jgi:hypothetical protein
MIRRLAVLTTITAALALPATAAADDNSLYAAFHGRDAAIQQAGAQYKKAARRSARHKLRSRAANRAVIAADVAINQTLEALGPEVAAQQPSSDAGAKAKSCALKDLLAWDTANKWEIRGLRAANKRHWGRAARFLRRATRAIRRQDRYGVCQRKQFAAAGIPNPGRTGGA